jgi:hypothetical protein
MAEHQLLSGGLVTKAAENDREVVLPFTLRSDLSVTRLDQVLIQMIEAHAGCPCPTRKEVMEWTGLPRRRIWNYLSGMRDRGLIEIEEYGRADPKRRRIRPHGGAWTGWTARRPAQKAV